MGGPTLKRLYPSPGTAVEAEGLYLTHGVRDEARAGRCFVYTNFVTSIDGRISVTDGPVLRGVPSTLANSTDWRLYQELAAQADVVITSGRFVREHADGVAGRLLTFPDDPQMADIAAWRRETLGADVPDVAVVSRNLDFDLDAAASIGGRVVAIGSAAILPDRMREFERAGVGVVLGASPAGLTGTEIASGLFALGYRNAFSAAGPGIAHTLIEAGVLDRLYMTQVFEILGGRNYVTLNEGSLLDRPLGMDLLSLYLDEGGRSSPPQLFASYASRD
jgi:riboflavin biosynthesis pyrimidine reductase